jgi:hypothetical protein
MRRHKQSYWVGYDWRQYFIDAVIALLVAVLLALIIEPFLHR